MGALAIMKKPVIQQGRRQIIVPQPLWDKVLALSAADFTNASSTVRTALLEYIFKRSLEAKRQAKERAKLAVG